MNFEEYIIEWKKLTRLKAGDGWKMCQDQIIRDHILPYLHGRDVRDITHSHISEVLNIGKLKGHSQNTQRKIYNTMSKIFNDAVDFFEIIQKSPVKKKFHRPILDPIENPSIDFEQSIVVLEYVFDNQL